MADPVKVDVFKFMNIRSPQTIPIKARVYDYINDEQLTAETSPPPDTLMADIYLRNVNRALAFWEKFRLPRTVEESSVAGIIADEVFKNGRDSSKWLVNLEIETRVIDLLPSLVISGPSVTYNALPKLLEQGPYFFSSDRSKVYFLPGATTITAVDGTTWQPTYSLASTLVPMLSALISAKRSEMSVATTPLNIADEIKNLVKQIKSALGLIGARDAFLLSFLLTTDMQTMKADAFENLYRLYVLKRYTSASLEPISQELRVIHFLEILALDEYLKYNRETPPANWATSYTRYYVGGEPLAQQLEFLLKTLRVDAEKSRNAFIESIDDIDELMQADPVIPPVVARRAHYLEPFNAVRPIGLGDLKVVKQWLCGYELGEISYIHNVMSGEINERTFRNLEKTEETFSYTSEQSSETQKENAVTDKFEVKREVETTLKNDLNLTAGASFSYNGNPVTVNLTGNIASNNSRAEVQKTANNFARDVIEKAVSKVQSKSSTQRSTNKLFETEESYKHSFANSQQGAKHISGIYRWVDKKYKAQLYNYGKRLMFEFIIPEPGAYLVHSRLKNFEFTLGWPQKPDDPSLPGSAVRYITVEGIDPATITEARFIELSKIYDLSQFVYPKGTEREISLSAPGRFLRNGTELKGWWERDSHTFNVSSPELKDKQALRVKIEGTIKFHWKVRQGDYNAGHINSVDIYINGIKVPMWEYHIDSFAGDNKEDVVNIGVENTPISLLSFGTEMFEVKIDTVDAKYFDLGISVIYSSSPQAVEQFQRSVAAKILTVEQAKASEKNAEIRASYDARMSDYNNEVRKVKAQAVNDILQGKSESYNKSVIATELKKHCITMIAKEFDSEPNDLFGGIEAVTSKKGVVPMAHVFTTSANGGRFEFANMVESMYYPAIDLRASDFKGKYVQFLEQAFEWQQLSYVLYPYFWATENKWIDMMNHIDQTDPNMSAFLQAGSVKVLVAVSPAYDAAVSHFLATGEPWENGNPPVIGDPLYLPIHKEIRKSQDDLEGATAEGPEWRFTVPTSLVFLYGENNDLPADLKCES